MSVPVFQHFATSSDHADNVCVVSFGALVDIWSGTLGLAQVFHWNNPVFQCAEMSSAAVNMAASDLDMVSRFAVLVRSDCVATYLLSQRTLAVANRRGGTHVSALVHRW